MRRIIVTGGSRGIGAAVVKKFADNGDKVVFLYKSSTDAARSLAQSTNSLCIQADLSDSEAARLAMESAISLLSGVDVLVNCAGIAQIKLFTDLCDKDWMDMIDTDLSGCFYACRAVSKEMIKQQSGRIINIGSMWGKTGASCEVHYSAAKAGVRGLTMALAKELGPYKINVNSVAPGVVMRPEENGGDDRALKTNLLGKQCMAEDIANLVEFLVSDKAGFITGQTYVCDGGRTLSMKGTD